MLRVLSLYPSLFIPAACAAFIIAALSGVDIDNGLPLQITVVSAFNLSPTRLLPLCPKG